MRNAYYESQFNKPKFTSWYDKKGPKGKPVFKFKESEHTTHPFILMSAKSNTFAVKDAIKKRGGKWFSDEKKWRFSKNNQEDLDHFIALVKKMQEPVRPPPRKPLNFKRFADHKNCECYIDSEGYFFDCVLCKYACCKECHKTEYGYKCVHHEDPLNSIGTEGT